MLNSIRTSVIALLFFTFLTGVLYPFASTVLFVPFFPEKAEGSLIKGKGGEILGSELIGQNFTAPRYFWSRLSATSPQPYNAAASSGSNLGAASDTLKTNVEARIAALHEADPGNTGPIPVDLVTASGSGLDPHISPAAAAYQIKRVAAARGMSEDAVKALVATYTEGRQWGFLGEPRVNILKLNLALDGKI